MTSLHFAADSEGAVEILSALASSCDVNARNKVGRTALHLAAKRGHVTHLRALLDSGCDRRLKDKFGVTALGVAIKFGRSECVDLLLYYEPCRKEHEPAKIDDTAKRVCYDAKEGEMKFGEDCFRQICEARTGDWPLDGVLNKTRENSEDNDKNGFVENNAASSATKANSECVVSRCDKETAVGVVENGTLRLVTRRGIGNADDTENWVGGESGSKTGDVGGTMDRTGNEANGGTGLGTGSDTAADDDTQGGTGTSCVDHDRDRPGNEVANRSGNYVIKQHPKNCACVPGGTIEMTQKAGKYPAHSKRSGGKTDISKELLHLVQALVSWKRDTLDNTLNYGRLCVACRVHPNTYYVESKLLDGVLQLLSTQTPFAAAASLQNALLFSSWEKPLGKLRSSRLLTQSMLSLRDLQRNTSGQRDHLVVLLSDIKSSMDSRRLKCSSRPDYSHPRSFSLPSSWNSYAHADEIGLDLDDFAEVFVKLSKRVLTHPKAVEKLLDSMFTAAFSRNTVEMNALASTLLKKSAQASGACAVSDSAHDLLLGVVTNLHYVIKRNYAPVAFSEALFDALLGELDILTLVLDEQLAFFESLLIKSLEDDTQEWNADRTGAIFLQICHKTALDCSLLEKAASAFLSRALAHCAPRSRMAIATSILMRMGLLKGEEEVNLVKDLRAPLTALEHVFQQDFFPRSLAAVFASFLAKPNPVLCGVHELRLRALKAALLREILPANSDEAGEGFGGGFKRICDALLSEGFWALAQDCCDELALRAWAEPSSQAWRAGESLLVSLGLIKSETQTELVRSMRNALKLLKHLVDQPYFPEVLIPMFRLFLGKPNSRLDSCRKGVDEILGSLQGK